LCCLQAHGGVAVSSAEIEAAFRWLCPPGSEGKLNITELRHKLKPFYPDISIKEVRAAQWCTTGMCNSVAVTPQ